MKRALALGLAAGLVGCGWMHGTEQHTENAQASSPKATKVFVTYHGPERLTQRFRRFFEIATEDYGVVVADNAHGADVLMDVTIAEKQVQEHINARVLHAGFVLTEGRTATVEHCLSISNGVGSGSSLTYTGVAEELKEHYPSVSRVFVETIKSNAGPQVMELIKKELANRNYVLAANRGEADAVLSAVGLTFEGVPMKATQHHIHYNLSGGVTDTYDANPVIYTAIDPPVPENAKACLSDVQSWVFPNSINQSDGFWGSALSAARDLSKGRKDYSKKD